MKHVFFNQLVELESHQARQQIRSPIELSASLYSKVPGLISHKAVIQVEEQRKLLAGKDLPMMPTSLGSSQNRCDCPTLVR